MEHRAVARRLAQVSLARGDAIGWFEELYATSDGNPQSIPWADLRPNPNLTEWLDRSQIATEGISALIVGCGLGDDAEELSKRGFEVLGFDVAPTAIDWCRRRFLNSRVKYVVADLFRISSEWQGQFDFVFEAYTLQVLPPELRFPAMQSIASCISCRGTLLVIARARNSDENEGTMPWPLTRDELERFQETGLAPVAFEDFFEQESTPVRRFRVEYRRPE